MLGKNEALGIALGLVLGFFLCGAIFSAYLDLPSQAPTHRDAQTDSNGPTKNDGRDSELNEPKAPIPVQIVRTQDDKDKERAEESHAREHTEIEKGMLSATWWLVTVTGALAVFTALLYASTQSIATDTKQTGDRQRADMANSIGEAGRAATAMENVAKHFESNVAASKTFFETNKQFATRQMRAYLSVTGSDGSYQDDKLRFQGNVILLNAGNTPAHKVRWRAKADILPFPLPADFDFPLAASEVEEGPVLGPHQTFKLNQVCADRVADSEIDEIMSGAERALYVWGIVTYEDVFEEKQQTYFCLRYIFRGRPPQNVSIDSFYERKHNRAT